MWKFLIKIKVILITLPLLSTCCIISAQSKYLLSDLERKHISLEQYMKMSNKERYENKLPLENITEEMLDIYKKRQQGILPESTPEPLSPSQEFIKRCEALVEKNPIVLGDHPYTPKFLGDFEDKWPRGSFGFNLASTYGIFYTLNGDYIAYEIKGEDVNYYVTKAYKDGSKIHNFRVGRSQISNSSLGFFMDVIDNTKLQLRGESPEYTKIWWTDNTGGSITFNVDYRHYSEEPIYLGPNEAESAWDLVEYLWANDKTMPATLNPNLDFPLHYIKNGTKSNIESKKLAEIHKKQAEVLASEVQKLSEEFKKNYQALSKKYGKVYVDAVFRSEFKIGTPKDLLFWAIDSGFYVPRLNAYRLDTQTANASSYKLYLVTDVNTYYVGWIKFVNDKLASVTWR